MLRLLVLAVLPRNPGPQGTNPLIAQFYSHSLTAFEIHVFIFIVPASSLSLDIISHVLLYPSGLPSHCVWRLLLVRYFSPLKVCSPGLPSLLAPFRKQRDAFGPALLFLL